MYYQAGTKTKSRAAALAIFFLLTVGQSCSTRHSQQATHLKQHDYSVTKLDNGPMTLFDSKSTTAVRVAPNASPHRQAVLVNDPSCPLKLADYSYETAQPNALMMRIADSRIHLLFHYTLTPEKNVTAWSLLDIDYDEFNRPLHQRKTHEPQSDPILLAAGTKKKCNFVSYLNGEGAEDLVRWHTTVIFMESVRTQDGTVWNFDKARMSMQLKALSLEPPDSYAVPRRGR